MLLYAKKDKIDNQSKNGVYCIKCLNCNKLYIGETKRYFKTRLNEHKSYVQKVDIEKSPIAEHVHHLNHTIDWNGSKVLVSCDDFYKRKLSEALVIRGYSETLLFNRDKELNINNIWNPVIQKRDSI